MSSSQRARQHLASDLVQWRAEALDLSLQAEQDFLRWRNLVAESRSRAAASTAPGPKWNPSSQTLKPIDDSLEFIASQRRRADGKRAARRAEQKVSKFSNLMGYHYGQGSLPADGMEGLGRGEDEERAFDPPLLVCLLVGLLVCLMA